MRAHLIDIYEWCMGFENIALQHLYAFLKVLVRKWRCRDIDDEVGAFLCQVLHKIAHIRVLLIVIPTIFTDRKGYFQALDLYTAWVGIRFKVSVLIKHVVVRQQGFVVGRYDVPLRNIDCSIEKSLSLSLEIGYRSTNDAVYFLAMCRNLLQ